MNHSFWSKCFIVFLILSEGPSGASQAWASWGPALGPRGPILRPAALLLGLKGPGAKLFVLLLHIVFTVDRSISVTS